MSAPDFITLIRGQMHERARALVQELQRDGKGKSLGRMPVKNSVRVVLEVVEGVNDRKFVVMPVEVWEGGVRLLHGKFVAPRTRAQLVFEAAGDSGVRVDAMVHSCVHRSGSVHELEMVFVDPVDLSVFALKPEICTAPVDMKRVGELAERVGKLVRNGGDIIQVRQCIAQMAQCVR